MDGSRDRENNNTEVKAEKSGRGKGIGKEK